MKHLELRYILLFLSTSLLILSLSAMAESEPWYQVEMIMFANQTPAPEQQIPSLTTKLIPDEQQTAIQLLPAAEADLNSSYPLVPQIDFLLQTTAKRLGHAANYRVLEHLAWLQPITQERKPAPVMINNNLSEQVTPDNIHGLLWIKKARGYFNVKLLLQLEQTSDDGTTEQHYQILQQQRVRSKRLVYFDHPLFGALVKITPAKTPTPPPLVNDPKTLDTDQTTDDDWAL